MIIENIVSISADACFKAASIAIRDFPATLEIDGCEINTEPVLVSYIKQMLSVLLVVPVQYYIMFFYLVFEKQKKNYYKRNLN